MPLTVTRLKENLASTQECTDEDANHLDELKKCFETNNFVGVKEKQIQILSEWKKNIISIYSSLQHSRFYVIIFIL